MEGRPGGLGRPGPWRPAHPVSHHGSSPHAESDPLSPLSQRRSASRAASSPSCTRTRPEGHPRRWRPESVNVAVQRFARSTGPRIRTMTYLAARGRLPPGRECRTGRGRIRPRRRHEKTQVVITCTRGGQQCANARGRARSGSGYGEQDHAGGDRTAREDPHPAELLVEEHDSDRGGDHHAALPQRGHRRERATGLRPQH
jgi:hypothetical protein